MLKPDNGRIVRLVHDEKPLCYAWECSCGWVNLLDAIQCLNCKTFRNVTTEEE